MVSFLVLLDLQKVRIPDLTAVQGDWSLDIVLSPAEASVLAFAFVIRLCTISRALPVIREEESDIFRIQGSPFSLPLAGRSECQATILLEDSWPTQNSGSKPLEFFPLMRQVLAASTANFYQHNWAHHVDHPTHVLKLLSIHGPMINISDVRLCT